MADGPPHYPSPSEITSAANKVVDAAVKVRGEQELRYVPLGDNPWRGIAGRSAADYPSQAGPYGGFAIGPDQNYLGTDADWATLRDHYAWIPDLFVHRIDPDPALFQPLIDGMEQTALAIHDDRDKVAASPVSQYIDDASGKISNWKGAAADTFQLNFLSKLKIAARNQAFIAGAMMHAMIAERDIFVKVRQDLLNLANQAVNAIEASGNKDPGGIKAVLGVVAAVTSLAAGIASIPISGGLLAPAGIQAGLWVISGFSATMGLAVPSDSTGSPLSAGSVDGVLSNMIDAVSRIDTYIDSHERDVVKSLNSCHSTLTTEPGRDTLFLPREPSLVHEPDSQIHHDFQPP
jgi:hypothetical protein